MSGSVGQVREALGRIEGKLEAMAGDIRWLMENTRSGGGDERTKQLLTEVTKLQKQVDDIHDPVIQLASYRRRVVAICAGLTSFGGVAWAFAQPVYTFFVEHLRFQW